LQLLSSSIVLHKQKWPGIAPAIYLHESERVRPGEPVFSSDHRTTVRDVVPGRDQGEQDESNPDGDPGRIRAKQYHDDTSKEHCRCNA